MKCPRCGADVPFPTRKALPDSVLRALYVEERWSLKLIGDYFQVDPKTIQRHLDRLGIPRRKNGWQHAVQRAQEDREIAAYMEEIHA